MEEAAKVTVADMNVLVERIFKKREEKELAEIEVTKINKELTELKAEAVAYLKELGQEGFKSPAGSISIRHLWRVGLPKTEEDRAKFFQYLKDQGVYEQYITVNSQSLNSYYMAEWEIARKEGRGMEFSIPGVGQPTLFEDLGIRK